MLSLGGYESVPSRAARVGAPLNTRFSEKDSSFVLNPTNVLIMVAIYAMFVQPSATNSPARPASPPSLPPLPTRTPPASPPTQNDTAHNFTRGIAIDMVAVMRSDFEVAEHDANVARMLSLSSQSVSTRVHEGGRVYTMIEYQYDAVASQHMQSLSALSVTDFAAMVGMMVMSFRVEAVGFEPISACFATEQSSCDIGQSCGAGTLGGPCMSGGFCGAELPRGLVFSCGMLK